MTSRIISVKLIFFSTVLLRHSLRYNAPILNNYKAWYAIGIV